MLTQLRLHLLLITLTDAFPELVVGDQDHGAEESHENEHYYEHGAQCCADAHQFQFVLWKVFPIFDDVLFIY